MDILGELTPLVRSRHSVWRAKVPDDGPPGDWEQIVHEQVELEFWQSFPLVLATLWVDVDFWQKVHSGLGREEISDYIRSNYQLRLPDCPNSEQWLAMVRSSKERERLYKSLLSCPAEDFLDRKWIPGTSRVESENFISGGGRELIQAYFTLPTAMSLRRSLEFAGFGPHCLRHVIKASRQFLADLESTMRLTAQITEIQLINPTLIANALRKSVLDHQRRDAVRRLYEKKPTASKPTLESNASNVGTASPKAPRPPKRRKALGEMLRPHTVAALKSWPGGIPLPGALVEQLRDELNLLISGPSLSNLVIYADVAVRPEVNEFIGQNPERGEVPLLNRLLLEDFFPNAIAECQPLPAGDGGVWGTYRYIKNGRSKDEQTIKKIEGLVDRVLKGQELLSVAALAKSTVQGAQRVSRDNWTVALDLAEYRHGKEVLRNRIPAKGPGGRSVFLERRPPRKARAGRDD